MGMANNRRLEETFNDGWLKILTQTTKRNELGKKIGVEDTEITSLKFRNLSMRDSDITAMDAMGSKLTKKVKTPFHPIAKKFNKDQYFIVIDSMRYNVIYADYDNFYIYFYNHWYSYFFLSTFKIIQGVGGSFLYRGGH